MQQMCEWYHNDLVSKWFKIGEMLPTVEEVTEKYIPYISGEKPTQAYIILIDCVDVGYIQKYFISDYPDFNEYVQTDDNAVGIDLFIGHRDYIYKGYGKYIIIEFLKNYVFSEARSDKCIIGPEPKNISAIKAYEKAGFKWYKNIQIPSENEPEYLMVLNKSEFNKNNGLEK